MAKLEYRALSPEERETEKATLREWTMGPDRIEKNFKFEQYEQGVTFACAVAFVANHLDHHPDITIGYKEVSITSSTHATGGLSPFDFELARRIDGLTA